MFQERRLSAVKFLIASLSSLSQNFKKSKRRNSAGAVNIAATTGDFSNSESRIAKGSPKAHKNIDSAATLRKILCGAVFLGKKIIASIKSANHICTGFSFAVKSIFRTNII